MEPKCQLCDGKATHECLCQNVHLCVSCFGTHAVESPTVSHSFILYDQKVKYPVELNRMISSFRTEASRLLKNKRDLLQYLDELQIRQQVIAGKMIEILSSEALISNLLSVLDRVKTKKIEEVSAKSKSLSEKLEAIKEQVQGIDSQELRHENWPWDYLISSMSFATAELKDSCIKSFQSINYTKFSKALEDSLTFQIDVNFSPMFETQSNVYYPVQKESRLIAYNCFAANLEKIQIIQAIPFDDPCTSFTLPDNSIAVVGSINASTMVQRLYRPQYPGDQWRRIGYRTVFRMEQVSCYAYFGSSIYAIGAAQTNHSLNLNTDVWELIAPFKPGFASLTCTANVSGVMVIGKLNGQSSIMLYNYSDKDWMSLSLSTKLSIDTRPISIEHFFLLISDSVSLIVYNSSVESIDTSDFITTKLCLFYSRFNPSSPIEKNPQKTKIYRIVGPTYTTSLAQTPAYRRVEDEQRPPVGSHNSINKLNSSVNFYRGKIAFFSGESQISEIMRNKLPVPSAFRL